MLNLMYKLEEQKYDYGTLLHLIYIYGRLGDREKKMVHCILAYYTIRLSKIYYSTEMDDMQLINFCAGSISGSLTNYMLPDMIHGTTFKSSNNNDNNIRNRKSKFAGYIELFGNKHEKFQINGKINSDNKENDILELIRNIEICFQKWY